MTGITSNVENLIAWLLDHTHLEIPDVESSAKPTVQHPPPPPIPPPIETIESVEAESDSSSGDESADDSDSFDYDLEDPIPPFGNIINFNILIIINFNILIIINFNILIITILVDFSRLSFALQND